MLWDVRRGLALRHSPVPSQVIGARFVGQDRVLLATEDEVLLRHRVGGKAIRTIGAVDVPLKRIAVSADSRLLAAANAQGSIFVWEIDTGEKISSYFDTDKAVTHAAFSASGNQIVAALAPLLARRPNLPIIAQD